MTEIKNNKIEDMTYYYHSVFHAPRKPRNYKWIHNRPFSSILAQDMKYQTPESFEMESNTQ